MNPKSNTNTKLYADRLIKMEVFLDFDPVFPGWPPMEANEEIGNELNGVDHRHVSGGLLDLDVQRSHGSFSRAVTDVRVLRGVSPFIVNINVSSR